MLVINEKFFYKVVSLLVLYLVLWEIPASAATDKKLWTAHLAKFSISKLSLHQKGLILVAIPLCFELLFVAVLTFLAWQSDIEAQRAMHAAQVSECINKIIHDLLDFSSTTKGQAFASLSLLCSAHQTFRSLGNQLLKKAQLNCGRMLSLINDLLDIERIKAGGLKISSESTAIDELFESATQSISAWAEDRGVTIKSCPAPYTVSVDKKRIIQVLVNLLSNALKFSPAGAVVQLDTSASSKDDTFIELRVIDQGRGVPEDMRESIFERFQQVKPADATEKGGSGLGLAICKAIVELHGGVIKVEPNDAKGSIFSFTVPVLTATTDVNTVEGKPVN